MINSKVYLSWGFEFYNLGEDNFRESRGGGRGVGGRVLLILANTPALARLWMCFAEHGGQRRAAEITVTSVLPVYEEREGTAQHLYQYFNKRCVGLEKPIQ